MSAACPAFNPLDVPLDGLQLIEASAGTGKTYTICLLYLRLLLERDLPVERLLVVTFTNAAAAELRDRIRRRLVELHEALAHHLPPATAGELQHLVHGIGQRTGTALPDLLPRLRLQVELALQAFDRAAVFTIHGFCQRALGDAPFVAGAPLQTELLTSDDALRLEVVSDFWRRAVAGQAHPSARVQALRARKDSPASFAALLRQAQSRPLARALWGQLALHEPPALADAQRDMTAAWATLQALWPEAMHCVPAMVEAAQPGLNGNVFKAKAVLRAQQDWHTLLSGDDPWAVPDGKGKLHLYRRDKLVFSGKGSKLGLTLPDHPLFDAAQQFLDARSAVLAAGDEMRRALLRDMLAWCGPALRERKRALRVQAFDDMLFNLHAALHGERGDALAVSLRQRYAAALVDEFQDTDPLQWQILQRIYAGSGLPQFLVGDPKQAIYRFRNADLPTYLAARQCVAPAARHTLQSNQRSTPALIEACNTLFAVHDAAFIEDGLVYPVVQAGARPKAQLHDAAATGQAALQVWLLPRDAGGAVLPQSDALALAAAGCAAEVVRLLQGAASGQVRLDAQPLQAGDIAVLVQSHRQGRLMRAALEARGVQCVELSQASVFASADAADLLRILHAVLEPSHEPAVREALATTWLGATAGQIDALAGSQSGFAPVMEGFAEARLRWRTRGFAVMMRRLLERHAVHARLLQRADGPRRLTNLRQLLELLHVASRTQAGAEGLVTWLRQEIEQPQPRDDRAQLRLESDAQLVHIITVHAAKGLEYAVVFCPFLWVNSQTRSHQADCIEYASPQHDHGLVLDYRSSAEREADQAWITTAQRQADDAERLRLIYVALTRAKQRCYVVAGAYASGRARQGGAPNIRQAASSPLNWLVLGAGHNHATWREQPPHDAAAIDAAWCALTTRVTDAGTLSVCTLPPAAVQVLSAAPLDPATVQAAAWPAWVPPRRRLGSYSGLVSATAQASTALEGPVQQDSPSGASASIESLAVQEVEQRDHDRAIDAQAGGEPLPASAHASPHADDILQFPRGADAGTCLHGVFERVQFDDDGCWPDITRQVLVGQGLPVSLQPMVLRMLGDVLNTPLPPGFRLADLAPARCQAEMEFHLPARNLQEEALREVLARHQWPSPDLTFPDLHGHLKGFIDLVFEHQGRWYVLDWKSNHLGDTPAHYAPAALAQAMARHDYGLQALLYLLALDRLLACRLRGYDRARHLGGALYLFVRGVRPHWRDGQGAPTGIWYQPASAQALDDLSAALNGPVTVPEAG